MAGKRKHYAVARGRSGPAIYGTWDECSAQVTGVPGARYKSFKTRSEAEDFLANEKAQGFCGMTTQNDGGASDTGSFGAAVAAAGRSTASGSSSSGMSGGGIIDLCSEDSRKSDDAGAGAGASTTAGNKRAKYDNDRKPAAVSSGAAAAVASAASSEPVDLCDSSDEEASSYGKATYSANRGKKKGGGYHGDSSSKSFGSLLKTPNALQSKAIEAAKRGDNIFITGPAGTGKSVVLSHIMHHLKTKYRSDPNKFVAVAPTGPTAISVGGQTIHSFAGCGVPETSKDFEKVWEKKNRTKWRDLEVLVIEEISMISGEFFDRLSDVVCKVRGTPSSQPFGGIQLITCGDFLQLPPIPKSSYKVKAAKDALARQGKSSANLHQDRGFAFQSKAWRNAGLEVIQLDQVFRQKNNSFISVLHEIRFGKVSQESAKYLERCNRPLPPNEDGIEATKLYATNKNVTAENNAHLNKLPGAKVSFQATDFAEPEDDAPGWAESSLLRNGFYHQCLAEAELDLKKGAQVMLIKNEQTDDLKNRLVNGSRGKIVGFTNTGGKRRDDESDIEVEDDDSDDDGQSYPIVQFQQGRRKVIRPERFESRIVGLGTCVRKAVPLKLAWAVTMHKSQGLTLDYIKADVGGVFTEAQAYVALSRATNEEGLELRNFSPRLVRADKRALAFYANPSDPTINRWDEPEDVLPVNAPAPSFRSPNEASSSTAPPAAKANALEGIAFVLTGEPVGYSRSAAEKLIKNCGGLVRGAVSGKTKYLVVGGQFDDGRSVQSGKKYQAAQTIMSGENKSGLKIIDLPGLFTLIRGDV